MLRKHLFSLLAVCLLGGSAARADELGFVECSAHPDDIQVFGKARQSHDVVAAVHCGERFTVVQFGFIFSRIQTANGQVGFVYSNLISVDRSGAKMQIASARTPVPQPAPAAAPAPSKPAVAAAAPDPAPQASSSQTKSVTAQSAAPQSAALPTASESAQAAPSSPDTSSAAAQPAPTAKQSAPTQVEASTQSSAAMTAVPEPAAAPAAAQPVASSPEPPAAPAAKPEPAPQPAAAHPEPGIQPVKDRNSWERPLPTARGTARIELFGGYAFARMSNGGGSSTNLMGAQGGFGYNVKPWLQVVADTTYNVTTQSGVKNILYGNHFGPRLYRRSRNRWGMSPFGEVLVGGSRADTKITGVGGYTTSSNTFSIKAGGGVDIHPMRHLEIRAVNVDYYRTSFGSVSQNNYWISTGIVLRFFGGGAE
jgi:hypothetical protein